MSATEARAASFDGVAVPGHVPWGFAEIFIISQTALPALLYLPGSQAFRLPIRFSAFAISLGAFAWYQVESTTQAPRSKMQGWITAIMSLLGLMLFHPETSSLMGGIAHIAVYFAVLAPLFWAPEFVKSPEQLARIIWILLLCSGANAVVGVLQVYDPGRWLPAEFSRVVTATEAGLGAVTYSGAQLNYTFFDLLFQYPLGAGLGRWGMAAGYFGSNNPNSAAIWAEIQFTGWMIDGGVVMIFVYLGAIATTTITQWQIAQATQFPRLAVCAAVILAAGLGPTLMIVSFTPFVAQIGIQYWFLAGALPGVACRYGVNPEA